MYLVSFARELEGDPARGPPSKSPLHVKGTGGSEAKGGKAKGGFVKLLQSYIRETVDPRAVKEARPSGGGSEMACPLTSAKQYLRGPKFTRQQYDEARRARARPDKEGALVRAWSSWPRGGRARHLEQSRFCCRVVGLTARRTPATLYFVFHTLYMRSLTPEWRDLSMYVHVAPQPICGTSCRPGPSTVFLV